jgi:hypothetical protein
VIRTSTSSRSENPKTRPQPPTDSHHRNNTAAPAARKAKIKVPG